MCNKIIIRISFQISGRNISSLESIAGRTIPVEGSYELSGDVSGHAPANIMLRNLDLKLAQNHFAGQATLNLVDEIPLIDAE